MIALDLPPEHKHRCTVCTKPGVYTWSPRGTAVFCSSCVHRAYYDARYEASNEYGDSDDDNEISEALMNAEMMPSPTRLMHRCSYCGCDTRYLGVHAWHCSSCRTVEPVKKPKT